MEAVKQFSPLLIAAKGIIVNHGSMSPSPSLTRFTKQPTLTSIFTGMTRTMPHPMTAAYNASKAALSQYSNTLRLELEPMDVKVIELVTGRVGTRLITVPTLDDTSIYKPLQPLLQSRAREAGMSIFTASSENGNELTMNFSTRNDAEAGSVCQSRREKISYKVAESGNI
jgi:1-acylglycerone phosphate reductase